VRYPRTHLHKIERSFNELAQITESLISLFALLIYLAISASHLSVRFAGRGEAIHGLTAFLGNRPAIALGHPPSGDSPSGVEFERYDPTCLP
jgi:hypothetical protein